MFCITRDWNLDTTIFLRPYVAVLYICIFVNLVVINNSAMEIVIPLPNTLIPKEKKYDAMN